MATHRPFLACTLFLAAGAPARLAAQDTVNTWVRQHYTQRDVMIPMRDGARLFSTIWSPRDSTQRWPILLTRTPYATDRFLSVFGPGPTFGQEGFIIVYQDVRGRFQSEGEFVNIRPYIPNKSGKQVDEASDTYDTISWLLANVPGTTGKSPSTESRTWGSTPRWGS
jgi:predicted acyl esterase